MSTEQPKLFSTFLFQKNFLKNRRYPVVLYVVVYRIKKLHEKSVASSVASLEYQKNEMFVIVCRYKKDSSFVFSSPFRRELNSSRLSLYLLQIMSSSRDLIKQINQIKDSAFQFKY